MAVVNQSVQVDTSKLLPNSVAAVQGKGTLPRLHPGVGEEKDKLHLVEHSHRAEKLCHLAKNIPTSSGQLSLPGAGNRPPMNIDTRLGTLWSRAVGTCPSPWR